MSTLAITGLSGEVGSLIIEELKNVPEKVIDLYHHQKALSSRVTRHVFLDLQNSSQIQAVLNSIKPDVILHLAGITHIDRCELDKSNGKKGQVWQVNVAATRAIANYASANNCHLVYLSTECVFDGKKTKFRENDSKHPVSWYGVTKAAAEDEITNSGASHTIARAVIAYSPKARKTMWQQIGQKIEEQGSIQMADDHWMTPTYIPDITRFLDIVLDQRLQGIYHIVPKTSLTPYEFASRVATHLGYSRDAVSPVKLATIMGSDRANLRLKHACLDAEKTESEVRIQFKTLTDVLSTL